MKIIYKYYIFPHKKSLAKFNIKLHNINQHNKRTYPSVHP
jgi:hypothetical protein